MPRDTTALARWGRGVLSTPFPHQTPRSARVTSPALQHPLPSTLLLQICFWVRLLFPEHHSWLSWPSLSCWGQSPVPLLTQGCSPRPREGPLLVCSWFAAGQGVLQTSDTARLVLWGRAESHESRLQPQAARGRCHFTAHPHQFASFEQENLRKPRELKGWVDARSSESNTEPRTQELSGMVTLG